uniref:Uncharacterized protein n=1 Tax=Desulfovibrio sp. U5L TaxID=596152 RepID=I2PZ28_9BACT
MATCCDCELFFIAEVHVGPQGERLRFCPIKKMDLEGSEKACPAFRSAYEGVFNDWTPRNKG